jgi:signal transduction histidine kinase
VNTTIVPIMDSRTQKIKGYFSVMLDITERKKDQSRKRKIANAVKSSATTGKYWATRQWYCA